MKISYIFTLNNSQLILLAQHFIQLSKALFLRLGYLLFHYPLVLHFGILIVVTIIGDFIAPFCY